jgi:LRR receptor-like serine/threonine-protein kinase FLS2
LRYLYFDDNKFSSTLPLSLWELRDILEIDISSNAFHGSIPVEIQNLRALIAMDLSSNQFSGNIPTTLGGLQMLQNLSLGSNKLQGSIPNSFGSLLSLEILDLSNNMLSGVIPESLVNLTSLTSFNVSFNELQGRIPTEGPFKNFSAQSYVGNYGLCGSTYLNVSSCRQSSHHERKSTIVLVLKFVLPAIAATILIVLLIIVVMRRRHLKRKTDSPNNGESLLTKVTWRMVSYHELFNATNGFNDDMLLGVGSFGSVYKGSLSDGMIFAVKVFKLQPEDRVLTSFEVECEVMRNIRHRNLVQIITACYGMEFQALVLQFMSNGSLDKWLHSDNHYLDMKQRIDIMIDVASALDYLHNWSPQPVAHCDLKPNNVLLDEDMIAHVADFGIAKLLSESDHVTHTITLATFGYMAPEYGIQGNVSTRSDVYSYGILLLEVFTRKRPTDSMFDGEMSLKSWVCQSLPDDIYKVVDIDLFGTNDEQVTCAKRDCALSILELALNCCAELPGQRNDMREVVNNLKKIKEKYTRDIEVTRPSRVTPRGS